MHNTKYWINKLIGKIKRNEKKQITKYFRNAGMKIGEGCTICCNIMTDDIIVAAGSVVTKSFLQRGIIIGGNPARMLTTWDEFYKKHGVKAMSRKDNNGDKIIEKR